MPSLSARPWTVSQAKAHLSTLLRHAKAGQPQIIGTREQYVVVPLAQWREQQRTPLGTWLVEEGAQLALDDGDVILPPRHNTREIPFSD